MLKLENELLKFHKKRKRRPLPAEIRP